LFVEIFGNGNYFINELCLFKLKKEYKYPTFFIRNIKKRRILKKDPDFKENQKYYFRKKYKMLVDSQGNLNFIKNNNIAKEYLHQLYISLKNKYFKTNKLKNNLILS
jgi:hypothetical protein